jgi:hypothetical protein
MLYHLQRSAMADNYLANIVQNAAQLLAQSKEYIWQLKQEIETINHSLSSDPNPPELIERKKALLNELQVLTLALKDTRLDALLREAQTLSLK